MISSGRAFLRRRQRGFSIVRGIQAPKLLTERSVSKWSSRAGSTPLPVIADEVGVGSPRAQLAQKDDDLATVVGRVIDEMPEHLPERVDVFAAAGGLYDARVIEPNIVQRSNKGRPLSLDLFPAAPHIRQAAEVSSLCNGWIGLPHPAVQPQLLGPHDMGKRAMNPGKAALQITEVLRLRQGSDRSEDDAVRPGVIVEQLEEFVQSWQQVEAQQASVDEAAVNCGCVSPTFTTNTSHR